MNIIGKEIKTAVLATLVLAVTCCGLYPLLITVGAQLFFPKQAAGSLLRENDAIVGSSLLAQPFTGEKYFHSRPSAAGLGYDAMSSGGSNLGPTSQKLYDQIAGNVKAYRKENGLAETQAVPADAVTASASGLDPHISLANAYLQAARVAKERGLALNQVKTLIEQFTERPALRIFGEPGVPVLRLNLALNQLKP